MIYIQLWHPLFRVGEGYFCVSYGISITVEGKITFDWEVI